jgi:plastocyanin
MSTSDPQWHSTDEVIPQAQHPEAEATTQSVPVSIRPGKPVSRMPAALMGMVIVILGGLFYASGTGFFKAQVGPANPNDPAVSISILSDTFSPAQVTVHPGQTIIWTNMNEKPQILLSDALSDESGQTLFSTGILSGSEYVFTLSQSQGEGTFEYSSMTTDSLKGTIVVVSPNTPLPIQPAPVTAPLPIAVNPSPAATSTTTNLGNTAAPSSGVKVAAVPEGTMPYEIVGDHPAAPAIPTGDVLANDALIPRNPYSVKSGISRTLDPTGSTPSGSHSSTASQSIKTATHPAAQEQLLPRPQRQPASGSETWFVVLGSIVAMYAFTRHLLRTHIQ